MALDITTSEFSADEIMTITAPSLRNASYQLGLLTRESVYRQLEELSNGPSFPALLDRATQSFSLFMTLVSLDKLTVDGTNFAQRYSETLEGFSEGAGISIPEAVLLQLEISPGCQTIIVRDESTGGLYGIHTEEDWASDTPNASYDYHLVRYILPNRDLTFFAYPGLCSYGPAFAIDQTLSLFQASDDLYIRDDELPHGLWHNAIAFMFFDAAAFGVLEKVQEQVSLLIASDGCSGGYGVHFLQYKSSQSHTHSLEFGGYSLSVIQPSRYEGYSFTAQANKPKDKELQRVSESCPPKRGSEWTDKAIKLYLEMTGREDRLYRQAMETHWVRGTVEESIETELRLLADPHGDIGSFKRPDGSTGYYHLGLPSIGTVAHVAVALTQNGQRITIGKGIPAPLPESPYERRPDASYPYAERKLWELIAPIREKYLRGEL